MTSAIRQRFEEGSPNDKIRLASAVGAMFDALYPINDNGEANKAR